jgi:hypothetical protein
MKKFTKIVLLGLTSGLLITAAAADPFNDRGAEWWRQPLSPGEQLTVRQDGPASTPSLGFNERGEDWVATVVSRNDPLLCPVNQLAAQPMGFNDKSAFGDDRSNRDDNALAVLTATPTKTHC